MIPTIGMNGLMQRNAKKIGKSIADEWQNKTTER